MKKILIALSIASISYLSAAALTTDKPVYKTTDTIKINFSEMDNHHKDWIGIYPEGSSTAWKNVVKWAWTENKSEGTLTFKNLPAGEYEVKGFYNNSYDAEATKAFKVQGTGAKAELTTTKPTFTTTEDVRINFKNINGATNDWLAIYPADKDNSWGNVVKWKFNKGGVKEGQANFDKLPAGKYEARVFYNNTFKMEGKVPFSVGEVNVVPVENATKILKLAKEHCLGKDGSTDRVLCSEEEKNIVYVLDSMVSAHPSVHKWQTPDYTGSYPLYRVSIDKNNQYVHSVDYFTNAPLSNHPNISERKKDRIIKKLKNTPIYATSFKFWSIEDYRFFYKEKLILKFDEHTRMKTLTSFTSDNGSVLHLKYIDKENNKVHCEETYDISNPNVAKLLEHKCKPV